VAALHRHGYDHTPLFLTHDRLDWGPNPFRDQGTWWEVVGFKDVVAGWWRDAAIDHPGSCRVIQKMRFLKQKVKAWNVKVFGHVEKRLEVLQGKEVALDRIADERPLTIEEQGERLEVANEIWEQQGRVDRFWKQKNRGQMGHAG